LPHNSVGVYKNGRVEIIANDQGNRITPSYVAFTDENERLVGDAAKNQLTSNPENTIFDVRSYFYNSPFQAFSPLFFLLRCAGAACASLPGG